jgi:hypothetical protein
LLGTQAARASIAAMPVTVASATRVVRWIIGLLVGW